MSNYKELTIVDAVDILEALIYDLQNEYEMSTGAEIGEEFVNKIEALSWAMVNLQQHPVYKASPIVQEREAGKYANVPNCD